MCFTLTDLCWWRLCILLNWRKWKNSWKEGNLQLCDGLTDAFLIIMPYLANTFALIKETNKWMQGHTAAFLEIQVDGLQGKDVGGDCFNTLKQSLPTSFVICSAWHPFSVCKENNSNCFVRARTGSYLFKNFSYLSVLKIWVKGYRLNINSLFSLWLWISNAASQQRR